MQNQLKTNMAVTEQPAAGSQHEQRAKHHHQSSSSIDDDLDCLMFKKLEARKPVEVSDDDDHDSGGGANTLQRKPQTPSGTTNSNGKPRTGADQNPKERKRKLPILSLSVDYNANHGARKSSHAGGSGGGAGGSKTQAMAVAPSHQMASSGQKKPSNDSESIGGATSTSEVNSNDDALSIVSRLSQIVVEQEVKLRASRDSIADEFDFADEHDEHRDLSDGQHLSSSARFSVHSLSCSPAKEANLKPVKSSGDIVASSRKHFDDDQADHHFCDMKLREEADGSASPTQGEMRQQQQNEMQPDEKLGLSEHKTKPGDHRAASIDCRLPEIQVDNYENDRQLSRLAASGPVGVGARSRAKSMVEVDRKDEQEANTTVGQQVPLRRNESSTFSSNYQPERGDLRSLESARMISRNEQQQRMRSNTAGSGDHQLMLNICRSAWTLSDFDQTFNKHENNANDVIDQQNTENSVQIDLSLLPDNPANGEQQQQQMHPSQVSRLNSNQSEPNQAMAARRVNSNNNNETNLLIRASKNALSLSQQQSNCSSGYFAPPNTNSNNNKSRSSFRDPTKSLNVPFDGGQQQQQVQQRHHQQYQQQRKQSQPNLFDGRKHSLQVQDFHAAAINTNCDYNSEFRGRRPSNSHSIKSFASSIDSFRSGKIGSIFRTNKWCQSNYNYNYTNKGKQFDNEHNCPPGEQHQPGWSCCCCNAAVLKRCVPILSWLPAYKMQFLWGDLMAGLVVAVLNISTSLSAAVVAETNLGVAFRTSIINTFVYSLLCSSRHTSFGSWSIMSQMLLISVRRALSDELILSRINLGPAASWNPEEYEMWHMNIIIMYTFLIGLVQLVSGLLNLGNIMASFIPEALCSSMIAATAFTMAIGQLANMCGTSNKILWAIEKNTTELWADLKNPPIDITDLFAGLFRWIQQIALLVKYYEQINLVCVCISVGSVLFLLFNQQVAQVQLKRLLKGKQIFLPSELILLILMIILSYCLNLSETYKVTTCGAIYIDFSLPSLPNLRLFRELWFDSLATALISFTMVYIMAKSYSNKLNYEIDCNQELIACGAGNLIGGLFEALPATASFSRTAGQVEAGGQTQLASLINCAVLILLAHFLGHHVSVLPVCVMSATLFYGFVRMMTRFREVIIYWRICKVDFAIWVVTFVSILTLDMLYGFLYGFIFSILTMLYRAQNRRAYLLGSIAGATDVYVPLAKYPAARELNGIKIFQFCGPIHYVCADLFEKLLRQKTRVNVKQILMDRQTESTMANGQLHDQPMAPTNNYHLPTHIILDFSMISYIDSAGIHVIKKIIDDYNRVNVTILLASLASHVAKVVKSEPTLWGVYKERFYVTLADAVHYAMRDTTTASQQHQQLQKKLSLSISCDSGGTNTMLAPKE